MAKLELTRDKIVNQIPLKCFELFKLMADEKVADSKTKMTEIKALTDALNTTIQAASNFYSLD